jgi:hydrogenase nickel incorporation protein HypA/HybF
MSIAQALIEQVGAEVEKSGHQGRVLALDVVVGRLSGVHADSLRFGFELLAPGTVVEGAELRITQPEAQLRCQACDVVQPLPELVLNCPTCGSDRVTIEGGQELLLQTIELEE